jgi:hypothetical protein
MSKPALGIFAEFEMLQQVRQQIFQKLNHPFASRQAFDVSFYLDVMAEPPEPGKEISYVLHKGTEACDLLPISDEH